MNKENPHEYLLISNNINCNFTFISVSFFFFNVHLVQVTMHSVELSLELVQIKFIINHDSIYVLWQISHMFTGKMY